MGINNLVIIFLVDDAVIVVAGIMLVVEDIIFLLLVHAIMDGSLETMVSLLGLLTSWLLRLDQVHH